jgi:hypothetical protein
MPLGISTTTPKRFVDTWNGVKWTPHVLAAANGTGLLGGGFGGLTCVSLTYCVLSGMSINATGTSVTSYLAAWNGKTVTAMKVPVPAGVKSMMILGASCGSTTSCVAVAMDSGTTSKTARTLSFTETWNGRAWAAGKLAWPAADQIALLEDVSCTASKTAGTNCMAVGAAGTSNTAAPVAASWNGKAWSVKQLPGPGAGKVTVFDGVSCLSVKQCTAIGESGLAKSGVGSPIAGFWNGSAWKLTAA